MRLKPLNLPRNASGAMQFRPEMADAIAAHGERARATGRWQTPEDMELSLKNPKFWAYWIHKTAQPITRAMQGHGIEETMAPFLRTRFDLRPPAFEPGESFTLSASGDLMATRGIERAQDRLYERVADLIFDANLAYANLESTLTTSAIREFALSVDDAPAINVTAEQYRVLTSHRGRRYDVVQLANNHILDCGEEGVRTTLAQLAADGIEQVGVNPDAASAQQVRIIEKHGWRIGFVAHTFSVNWKPFPAAQPWIVEMTPFHLEAEPDTTRIENQIRACRAAGCDLVLATLHWGLEFEFWPHPKQRIWAQRFVDAGADAVIGHHPHVMQPTEVMRPAGEPERQAPVLYSLGNLTPIFSHPATVMSLVARLRCERDRQGRAHIVELTLDPVALVQDAEADAPILVPLKALCGELSRELQADAEAMRAYAAICLGERWADD